MPKKQTPKGTVAGKTARAGKKSTLRDLAEAGDKVKGGTVSLQHEQVHAGLKAKSVNGGTNIFKTLGGIKGES